MIIPTRFQYAVNAFNKALTKRKNILRKQSCADCGHYFWYGEPVFHSKHGYRNFICQNCAERENSTCGDCVFFRSTWLCDEHRLTKSKNDPVNNCSNFERKHMPNIKITAEVNGKQVPLENISTETFEAIKALEKPKEIPVARVGHINNYPSDRRLFLKLTDSIRDNAAKNYIDVIAINLQTGNVNNTWKNGHETSNLNPYENIQSL